MYFSSQAHMRISLRGRWRDAARARLCLGPPTLYGRHSYAGDLMLCVMANRTQQPLVWCFPVSPLRWFCSSETPVRVFLWPTFPRTSRGGFPPAQWPCGVGGVVCLLVESQTYSRYGFPGSARRVSSLYSNWIQPISAYLLALDPHLCNLLHYNCCVDFYCHSILH